MIPKVIYQTYKSKKIPFVAELAKNRMKKLNPDYEFKLYDDNDILNFLQSEFDERTLKAYKKLTIGAAKADFFRYTILYKKGGIYLDLDAEITENLDNLIKNREAVISRGGKGDYFIQWMLVFNKKHPFLKKIIEDMILNLEEENFYSKDVLYTTGPHLYTKSINTFLKKENISSYTDKEINSYIEESGNNTIKNTIFYFIDYGKYAKCKIKYSWLMYIFKSHWRQEKLLGPYYLQVLYLFAFLMLSLVVFKLYTTKK